MTAIRHFFIALESGWRAGKKQARKRFTELQRGKPSTPQPTAQE